MQKRGIDKAENKQSENAATLFTARCTLQMFEKNMMIPMYTGPFLYRKNMIFVSKKHDDPNV
jgi:hypothetical protein